MQKTCCPMYTIKCDALQFRLSRSQKKILKKFKHFIEQGEITAPRGRSAEAKGVNYESSVDLKSESLESRLSLKNPALVLNVGPAKSRPTEPSLPSASASLEAEKGAGRAVNRQATEGKRNPDRSAPSWAPRGGMKAKAFRRERWRQKQLARGMEVVPRPPRNREKHLEERLEVRRRGGGGGAPEPRHTFEVRLVSTGSEAFAETFAESLDVYQRYQVAVHGDSLEKCSAKQFKRFLCKVSIGFL
jgi:arginine-tRNA-protein transferase